MSEAKDAGMGDSMPVPDHDGRRAHTASQLRMQARSCGQMGSPLYAHLLDRAADDCAAGGPTWDVLAAHAAPGRGDALALRFMAAVHRLVLQRRAPALALHYPSVGGTASIRTVWDAFRPAVAANVRQLASDLRRPCQTNEVGRSAGLMVGFLEVVARTGLPVRLLEVGASAGLNLRCDHFRIGGDGAAVGDPSSPVDLSSHWAVAPPATGRGLVVVERRGCDVHPVDPATVDGRLALTASVWADQRARLERLRGAIELAARLPAVVDEASLDAWTEQHVRTLPLGAATVVFHSVVQEYVPDDVRERFVAALHAAGERATADRPLAWVRLEPISVVRHHGVHVTLWPGGGTETVARCRAHGTDVEWLGACRRWPPRRRAGDSGSAAR